ncbi:ssDNA-binding protein, partial [Klebsiella pneumoniae]|uniref:ssDNA-binding protein n=1 Tax=Klebsiella pneumoniae TaxID=573 RepID=UPI003C6D5E02
YEQSGNKGVAFGLQNLQKLRDGEPLGGRVPASKAFEAVPSEGGSKTAGGMFD